MAFASDAILRIKPSATIYATKKARDLKRLGHDILFLSVGQPDFDTPENIKVAAKQAIDRGETKYPPSAGIMPLREAICRKFKRENDLNYSVSETIVGVGGKNVIFNALLATINPGDEVIIPAPYWVSYPDIVSFAQGTPVILHTKVENAYKITPTDLDMSITQKTKWLVLNSPSNPTGSVYTASELRALAEVLKRHSHVWVMADDIYEHLVYDGCVFSTIAQVSPELRDRVLIVNGVSKAYAMTGWRIGYAAGPRELIANMEKLQSQQTSGACTIAQWAAVEALDGTQAYIQESRDIFQARRNLVISMLNEAPHLACASPAGAFYVYPSCQAAMGRKTSGGRLLSNDTDFTEALLEEAGVAVVQGEAFGSESNFRFSYATSTDVLADARRRIQKFCSSLR